MKAFRFVLIPLLLLTRMVLVVEAQGPAITHIPNVFRRCPALLSPCATVLLSQLFAIRLSLRTPSLRI
jgi:hypothetical protein